MSKNIYKFVSKTQWLNEQQSIEPLYGCIMLEPTEFKDWEENHLNGIEDDDLYTELNDDSYGLEMQPHITLLYGIHEDKIDPSVIIDMMEQKLKPLTIEIKDIDVFENDKFDVVKYNVPITDQLQEIRDLFMESFENTQTIDKYNPHVTIAYVKPGLGKKYKKQLNEPFKLTLDKGVYSYHKENHEDGDDNIRRMVNLNNKNDKNNSSSFIKSKPLNKN